MRWVLIDESQDGEPVLVRCHDIDGLFRDIPPPPRDRVTLLGCDSALAAGEGPMNLAVLREDDQRFFEQLVDVRVTGTRPSAAPGRFDVELDAITGFELGSGPFRLENERTLRFGEAAAGAVAFACASVTGTRKHEQPAGVTVLRGCLPGPQAREMFRGTICAAGDDGQDHPIASYLSGRITAIAPASPGLIDITVDALVDDPKPAGARVLWESPRPTQPGRWHGLDRSLRHEWLGVALFLGRYTEDGRRDRVDLDGSHVTDIEGFYCALGEAVNGPGGYFGWNLDAVDDCLAGGFGAGWPLRITWHDSDVARRHMTAGYDPYRLCDAITFDRLQELLTTNSVIIDLR